MGSSLSVREKITRLARERILVLDGAMGALIQSHRTPSGEPLSEDDFRGGSGAAGGRFKNHPLPLKGCNDLLCLTMPDLISGIHEAYLRAGADIIETCSFNANAVSLAEFGLEKEAYEISAAAARLARQAADRFSTEEKPRFVAGSVGPTSKSAGIAQDMGNPGKRAIGWDELEAAYYDNARGLLDGGADLIIIETVFDTLNAKAAVFAVRRLAEERGIDAPVIVSATVSGAGGRLLSGQTVEAFCVSVSHANPAALGLNCSFGAEKLKAPVAAVSAAVPCLVIAYPNAGLPNGRGAYDESPESMADHIGEYMAEGIVNIAGGCCGSTPAHIAAIAERAKKYAPRPLLPPGEKTLLAGLEVLEISREEFARREAAARLAENSAFLGALKEADYDEAAEIAREMIEDGAALVEVCLDALPPADAEKAMSGFLNTALIYPDIARLPFVIRSARLNLIEAGLKCLPGKGIARFDSPAGGEAEFFRRAHLARSYGAAVTLTLPEGEDAAPYRKLLEKAGFPPEDIGVTPGAR